MVPCAESHLRVNQNFILSLRGVFMERAVNAATVTDDDGLKEVLLPFLVPILVFGFFNGIFHSSVGQGEARNHFF